MIQSKKDYKEYLDMDRKALGKRRKYPRILGDEIWKYERLLRRIEYINNCKKDKIVLQVLKLKLYYKGIKLGFSIPINVFEGGLALVHHGQIVVNGQCKIGKNCRIQEGVTIGATNGNKEAPVLGDNVYIGSGAKVIGNIQIGNNVSIGANSVVTKSFIQDNITIAGVPAKKISDNNSFLNLNPMIFEN